MEKENDSVSATVKDVWSHATGASHPAPQLLSLAKSRDLQVTDLAFARLLDKANPVRHLRDEFHYPSLKDIGVEGGDPDTKCIYFCGNSLGLQPRDTRVFVNEELDKWAVQGVLGHFNTEKRPWVTIEQKVKNRMAKLVGAEPIEVSPMNSLSVNLHVGMAAFYRPTTERYKILMESNVFPSDHYAVQSQLQLHGFDPEIGLITVEPRESEHTLRTEDIITAINKHGDSIALVLFSGVQYYTGQLFDMQSITSAAHSKGCKVGFDLAHAAGNVVLKLHDWEVDFACWCSYKYINSGPGGIGGFFIHKKYATDFRIPRMEGWWGHEMNTRFEMANKRQLLPGADGFQCSNPPVLETVSLLASLNVFSKTSMEELRQTSVLLTGYLELLLKQIYSKDVADVNRPYMELITPSDINQRGAQLSLKFSVAAREVQVELQRRGVIVDVREPNILRVAPAPLYNSFEDVHAFVTLLGESFERVRKQKEA